MKDLIINLFGYIGAISLLSGSCLGALLLFWHCGKKDIKEYLNDR